jgi:hypothetical protein
VFDFGGPGKDAGVIDVGIAVPGDLGDGPFEAGLEGDAATVEEGGVGVEGMAAMP